MQRRVEIARDGVTTVTLYPFFFSFRILLLEFIRDAIFFVTKELRYSGFGYNDNYELLLHII